MSLVGGGGKTTAMYRMADALRGKGLRVAAATTTRIGCPRVEEGRSLVLGEAYAELVEALGEAPQLPVLGSRLLGGDKVQGIPPEWCDRIMAERRVDCLVVEADGAARRPLKAPEAWEPVVPAATSVFVPVVGLSCLGGLLGPEGVFRAEKVAELTGLRQGDRIGVADLLRILTSKRGLLKGCPPGARSAAFLNQLDALRTVEDARALARGLLAGPYERVLLAALREEETLREVWTR